MTLERCCHLYCSTFKGLVRIYVPLNECALSALHLVYQPRLDKALKDFISFWNNHKLRTEVGLTPMQIRMQGFYCNLMKDAVRDTVDPSDFDSTNYGVD